MYLLKRAGPLKRSPRHLVNELETDFITLHQLMYPTYPRPSEWCRPWQQTPPVSSLPGSGTSRSERPGPCQWWSFGTSQSRFQRHHEEFYTMWRDWRAASVSRWRSRWWCPQPRSPRERWSRSGPGVVLGREGSYRLITVNSILGHFFSSLNI